jgi:hypothetical protein
MPNRPSRAFAGLGLGLHGMLAAQFHSLAWQFFASLR